MSFLGDIQQITELDAQGLAQATAQEKVEILDLCSRISKEKSELFGLFSAILTSPVRAEDDRALPTKRLARRQLPRDEVVRRRVGGGGGTKDLRAPDVALARYLSHGNRTAFLKTM